MMRPMTFVGFVLLLGPCLGQASTISGADASIERNLFAAEIYNAVATQHLEDNVVISPAAIQTSMALAYYGAKGKTASEIQAGLRLGNGDADQIARRFGEFQQTFVRDNNLKLVNNIYINENLEFKGKFRDLAKRDFESDVDKVDFHPPYNKRTADQINETYKTKTNGKITSILDAKLMEDRTQGLIVNAVSYGAPWQKAFSTGKTSKRSFSAGKQSFDVETMWTLNNFQFGDIASLDAKVIELPYKNNDFSMIVILPNRKDGLSNLLQKLQGKNLLGLLSSGMSSEKVEVYLPKFSVAFGENLKEPFQKLGVTTMFTTSGDFGNLYRMFVSHHIDAFVHKAYVSVSEEGVDQPLEASSGLKSLFSRNKKFEADHPFVFAIKHRESIIFMGHVANYAYA